MKPVFLMWKEANYAICLGWPTSELTIKSLGSEAGAIENVSLLGSDVKLEWTQDAKGLHIQPPAEKPCEHAFTFKITLKGTFSLRIGRTWIEKLEVKAAVKVLIHRI